MTSAIAHLTRIQEINVQNMNVELVAQMFKNYQSNVLFHLEGMPGPNRNHILESKALTSEQQRTASKSHHRTSALVRWYGVDCLFHMIPKLSYYVVHTNFI